MARKKKTTSGGSAASPAPKKAKRRKARKASPAAAPVAVPVPVAAPTKRRRAAPGKKKKAITKRGSSKPAKRGGRGRKRGGGMIHGVTWKSGLVAGGLVIGGAAAAIRLNKLSWRGPLGAKPATVAIIVTTAVAVGAHLKGWKKVAKGAACTSVGIATGILAENLTGTEVAAPAGGGGSPPT